MLEYVMFVTHETIDREELWRYMVARKCDVEPKHIKMAPRTLGRVARKWTDHQASVWGFLFTDKDEEEDDENIEIGRREAQAIFRFVSHEFPSDILDGTCCISKSYVTRLGGYNM